MPTSNISQTVKRLEEELGVKLFNRTANKISLSEEGRIFYEGVIRGLGEIKTARERLNANAREGEVCGEVTLLIEANRRLVTEAIERFRSEFPEVSIVISHSYDENTKYDIIVSDLLPAVCEYEARHLVTEPMRLACLENGIGETRSLSDFKEKRFISMSKNSRLYKYVYELCRKCGFTPDIAIQTDDPYYVRKYVEMGLGVAVVPTVSWRGLFSEKVTLVNIGDFSRSTYLYLPRMGSKNPASEKLSEIISDVFLKECSKAT